MKYLQTKMLKIIGILKKILNDATDNMKEALEKKRMNFKKVSTEKEKKLNSLLQVALAAGLSWFKRR